jgi:hypothetical protein
MSVEKNAYFKMLSNVVNRELSGKSITWLSAKSGISETNLNLLLIGEWRPSPSEVQKLGVALNINLLTPKFNGTDFGQEEFDWLRARVKESRKTKIEHFEQKVSKTARPVK